MPLGHGMHEAAQLEEKQRMRPMTNLAELKRLATPRDGAHPVHADDLADFRRTITPQIILSLIERVEKAEAHVSTLQMAVGEASKTAWQQGATREREACAKYHELEIEKIESHMAENTAYSLKTGRPDASQSARDNCTTIINIHRLSAAAIRARGE